MYVSKNNPYQGIGGSLMRTPSIANTFWMMTRVANADSPGSNVWKLLTFTLALRHPGSIGFPSWRAFNHARAPGYPTYCWEEMIVESIKYLLGTAAAPWSIEYKFLSSCDMLTLIRRLSTDCTYIDIRSVSTVFFNKSFDCIHVWYFVSNILRT